MNGLLSRTVPNPRALVVVTMGGLIGCCLAEGSWAAEKTLATVGGRSITDADLQLEAVLHRVPAEQIDQHQDRLLEELIDLRLIQSFLAERRIKANPAQVDQQVDRIHGLIRRGGEEPAAFLTRVGLTEDQLRERLSLGLAWESYVRQITTTEQLRRHFEAHRRELDGTQLRARHIILKVPREDAVKREAAVRQLTDLHRQIQSGTITFAEAAAEHSEAPSHDEGGDVGYFPYRGTMSADFADAAFALQVGELSDPVETAFGVHLIEITDVRPGQLSLEDVRGQVLKQISRRLWAEQVAQDRRRVPIQRSRSD